MQWSSQFLNWYFGMPADLSGEQVRWTVHCLPFWSGITALGLILATISLTGWIWNCLNSRISLKRGSRLLLIAVRCVWTILILVMLLQVSLTATSVGKSRVVVLLDTSPSMQLGDDYPPTERQALRSMLGRTLQTSRLELMKAAWLEQSGAFLKQLSQDHQLEFFCFDDDLRPLLSSSTENGSTNAEVENAINQLQTHGLWTNLENALGGVLKHTRGRPPEAILLITDGHSTQGDPQGLQENLQQLSQLKVPVSTVGIGSVQSRVDLALEQVRFDPVNFQETQTPIQFDVSAEGISQLRARVSLQHRGDSEEVLNTEEVELSASRPFGSGQLMIPGLSPGRHEFELIIEPTAGESELQNNSRLIHLQIRESRLGVLFVDQVPRWEFRHLKNALERDHDLQLSTCLLDQEIAYSLEDKTALARVPQTSEELAKFDAILLGDVDWSRLPQPFLNELPNFVAQRGGGLIWIPGPQNMGTQEVPQVLQDLFPGKISRHFEGTPDLPAWKLEFTREGRAHPVFQMQSTEAAPTRNDGLPVIYSPRMEVTSTAGATVLLQGTLSGETSQQPLLLSQRFGAGQVWLQCFDESWRWRWINDGEFYRRYWSQAVRFVAKQRMLKQLPPLELALDREEYQVGEPVEIRLFVNHSYSSEELPDEVQINDGTRIQSVSLMPVKGERTVFSATLKDLPAASYTAILPLPDSDSTLPTLKWNVVPVDHEREYFPQQAKLLRQVARTTGGRYFPLHQLHHLLSDLPHRHPGTRQQLQRVELWKRSELLFCLAGLLFLEWVLRRRQGLL